MIDKIKQALNKLAEAECCVALLITKELPRGMEITYDRTKRGIVVTHAIKRILIRDLQTGDQIWIDIDNIASSTVDSASKSM